MNSTEPTPAQRGMLAAINRFHALGRHIYAGTVPEHVVARRRRQSKAARAARRINRSR